MTTVLGFGGGLKPLARESARSSFAEQAMATPRFQVQLGRREWWLWLSAVLVTTLSFAAFTLTFFGRFFRHTEHFYEIGSEQARWATLGLLLIFNAWLVYRQWSFRRMRRQATGLAGDAAVAGTGAARGTESASLDAVTGLSTRAALEQQLGKEIARARRQNTLLSLATVHVDDLADIRARLGQSAVDAALKELARYMKRASRGSDLAARLSEDDFLLLLPECGVSEAKQVLNRVPSVEVSASGKRIPLTYTTGWVDYQPGDLPADVLKRAISLLHLYDSAAKSSFAQTIQ